MSETRFRRDYCKNFRDRGFTVDPVENSIGYGMPDVYHTLEGSSFWCELKQVDSKKEVIKFEEGQLPWMRRHKEAGDKCFVVIKCGIRSNLSYWVFNPLDFIDVKRPTIQSIGDFALEVFTPNKHWDDLTHYFKSVL